jgi:hypothetical protein
LAFDLAENVVDVSPAEIEVDLVPDLDELDAMFPKRLAEGDTDLASRAEDDRVGCRCKIEVEIEHAGQKFDVVHVPEMLCEMEFLADVRQKIQADRLVSRRLSVGGRHRGNPQWMKNDAKGKGDDSGLDEKKELPARVASHQAPLKKVDLFLSRPGAQISNRLNLYWPTWNSANQIPITNY